MAKSRHIVISDKQGALPYSKGLMASSFMAIGLSPTNAFQVAERIEYGLHERGIGSITRAELVSLAEQALTDEVGERYARTFTKWQLVRKLGHPMIILIGGATGVGKSTLATQLAIRLGITRIIPTDAIREVMRGVLTDDVAPALHTSSFDADRLVREPLPEGADALTVGFREQVLTVAVGIRALARRAAVEGTHLIIEGVHVIPGILDVEEFRDSAVVVPLILTVDDEDLHRSHFSLRALESHIRPTDRYLGYFEHIRRIQDYVKALAIENGTPVVPSYNLDSTLVQIIDLVIREAVRAVPEDLSGPIPIYAGSELEYVQEMQERMHERMQEQGRRQ